MIGVRFWKKLKPIQESRTTEVTILLNIASVCQEDARWNHFPLTYFD